MRAVRSALAALVAVLLVTVSAVAAPAAVRTATGGPHGTSIEVAPGVRLRAEVYEPAGRGPHPLVVMPASFFPDPAAHQGPAARRLAAAGYVVVGYRPRGLPGSGGTFGMAGPEDVADTSAVISWALARTPADARRVGLYGTAYGAGIGLLAASEDRRIRAVAALGGWVDLLDGLYGGGTRRRAHPLFHAAARPGAVRPGPEVRRALREYAEHPDPTPAFRSFAAARSPMTHLDRLNAHAPAVLLAHTWSGAVESPNQNGRYFSRLRTAKRLEYRRDDHATEAPAASAERWFDHHLRGGPGGAGTEPPVFLEARGRPPGHSGEQYDDLWATASGTHVPRLEPRTGPDPVIATGPAPGPPADATPAGHRTAAVWWTSPGRRPRRLRGIPALRTRVTPSAAEGTLVATLYDIGPTGTGTLVTHAPYSFSHRTPGTPFDASFDLFATVYDLPAGHRLALVVTGTDPLYVARNPPGATLTLHSAATGLALPVR
ncbi:CocE/NonD family hydrolase [Streptomyces hesseae]|uniref:CocE/NonD family hydrolase n=1 Tax=Streptomyces hesseae TaxID=3075519 RepID=A0ABU2SHU6_9ACTN|nr:CocE/NonD family hydrolase [Streptomyces sp. DSM 40473]MDT0448477.1 CocE/NonD family hydrolase [Streptomyces sp. DSM 40473]